MLNMKRQYVVLVLLVLCLVMTLMLFMLTACGETDYDTGRRLSDAQATAEKAARNAAATAEQAAREAKERGEEVVEGYQDRQEQKGRGGCGSAALLPAAGAVVMLVGLRRRKS
jgi:Flp pilus assembly protein TadB